MNLYGFVGNDGVGSLDIWGLAGAGVAVLSGGELAGAGAATSEGAAAAAVSRLGLIGVLFSEVYIIVAEIRELTELVPGTIEAVRGVHEAEERSKAAEEAFNAAALAALAIEMEATRGKCPKGCKYEKKPRIDGNSRHNEYAAKLADGEWLVTAPPLPPFGLSVSARYDSGRPGLFMYEAKTGHEFLHNKNLWYRPLVVTYLNAQFGTQSVVAKICGIGYTVAVDNESGARAIKGAVFSILEDDIRYTPR